MPYQLFVTTSTLPPHEIPQEAWEYRGEWPRITQAEEAIGQAWAANKSLVRWHLFERQRGSGSGDHHSSGSYPTETTP